MTETTTSPAEDTLGVRVLITAIRGLPFALGLAVIGAGLGAWSATFVERPFYTQATVEIGVRHPKEPIENPIVAAERLQGHLARAARAIEHTAWVSAEPRRNPAANRTLMRYLDLSVGARTSSSARAIADAGMASFLAEHEQLFLSERRLLDEEKAHWETWSKKVEDALAAVPAKHGEGSLTSTELTELEDALFESKRHINACATLMNDVRTPPTRVISRPSSPERPASKTLPRAVAGALVGALLGVFGLAARALGRPR